MGKIVLKQLNRDILNELNQSSLFEEDSPCYDKAFFRNKKCADYLYDGKIFHESYLHYMLCVECLLKDVYSMIRAQVYEKILKDEQASLLLTKTNKVNNLCELLRNELRVSRFSHDIFKVARAVESLFPEIREHNSVALEELLRTVETGSNWPALRYQDLDNYNNYDWKYKCDELKNALSNFIEKHLSHIYKSEGNNE